MISTSKNINIKHIINCSNNDINKLVRSNEASFKKQLMTISRDIHSKTGIEVVCIAGPSCAGKTTFTRMLCDKLRTYGHIPQMISLDNFFKNREETPFLEDGVTRDYESLNGLNQELMHKCFENLKKDKTAMFPEFDFVNGKSMIDKIQYSIGSKTILVVEGIHALNPIILDAIGFGNIYKVFISPASVFSYDKQVVINGEQLRYMRRIYRDMITRGNDPMQTFIKWPKVLAGEVVNINPYRYTADAIVDTTHPYELALYSYYLADILESMKYSAESMYLHHIITKIKGHTKSIIPDFSLMWEFMIEEE